jgi:hypothetical protein
MFKKLLLLFLVCASHIVYTLDAGAFLTNDQISVRRAELDREVAIKYYLSKSSYAVAGIMVTAALYQMGAFNFLFNKHTVSDLSGNDLAQLKADVAALKAARGSAIAEFGKAVFWQGATGFVGSLLVKTPLISAFTTPDYEWIFKDKTHILRISDDALFNAGRYARCIVAEPLKADHYKNELKTIIKHMQTDLQYLIAYLEYRVEQMGAEEAKATNMDGMPRFIYNLFNDFVKDCSAALDVDNGVAVQNLVKDLRGDLANCYDHCMLLV